MGLTNEVMKDNCYLRVGPTACWAHKYWEEDCTDCLKNEAQMWASAAEEEFMQGHWNEARTAAMIAQAKAVVANARNS